MHVCSCECVCLLRKVCNLSVQWLDIEQMGLATELDICTPALCLPGVIPNTNLSPTDSEPWLRCLTFCVLSIFAMFSILLELTEVKILYNIII